RLERLVAGSVFLVEARDGEYGRHRPHSKRWLCYACRMTSTLAPHLPGLLAIWMLAIVSPGPAFLVVSQLAAGRSRAAALGAALGITTMAIVYAALTLWGMGVLILQISWLGTALRIAGAVYLVYLGLLIFQSASQPSAETPSSVPAAADFTAGLRIGVLTGA